MQKILFPHDQTSIVFLLSIRLDYLSFLFHTLHTYTQERYHNPFPQPLKNLVSSYKRSRDTNIMPVNYRHPGSQLCSTSHRICTQIMYFYRLSARICFEILLAIYKATEYSIVRSYTIFYSCECIARHTLLWFIIWDYYVVIHRSILKDSGTTQSTILPSWEMDSGITELQVRSITCCWQKQCFS